jgi:hypothetical protein
MVTNHLITKRETSWLKKDYLRWYACLPAYFLLHQLHCYLAVAEVAAVIWAAAVATWVVVVEDLAVAVLVWAVVLVLVALVWVVLVARALVEQLL